MDFEDAPEIVKSGLYKKVYSENYGVFGGQPYGMIVSNYDFGPGPQDIQILQSVASVSAMSHAPFIGNSSPEFFRTVGMTSRSSELERPGLDFRGPTVRSLARVP